MAGRHRGIWLALGLALGAAGLTAFESGSTRGSEPRAVLWRGCALVDGRAGGGFGLDGTIGGREQRGATDVVGHGRSERDPAAATEPRDLGLLACGSFLIASIGVFRLDAVRNADQRSSGTGGFALMGESTLPVVHDLNTAIGREFYALEEADLADVRLVALRVRDGDDASCLNLNRAQQPRLLGVPFEQLASRGFVYLRAKVLDGTAEDNPWRLLRLGGASVEVNAEGAGRDPGHPGDRRPELDRVGHGQKVGDTLITWMIAGAKCGCGSSGRWPIRSCRAVC
jgi:putative ABC transport system permease protein